MNLVPVFTPECDCLFTSVAVILHSTQVKYNNALAPDVLLSLMLKIIHMTGYLLSVVY